MLLALTILFTGLLGQRSGDRRHRPTPRTRCPPRRTISNVCAPVGADTSGTCLRITLEAIDAARATRGRRARWLLPADFSRLTVPEQLFVAVDRERVDRGLAPFIGPGDGARHRTPSRAPTGAAPAPPGPGLRLGRAPSGSARSTTDSTPTSSGCTTTGPTAVSPDVRAARPPAAGPTATSSCDRFGDTGHLVMGAAFDPTGDTSPGDRGGSSLAATLAVEHTPAAPVRLHVAAGPDRHVGRDAATPAGDPRHGVGHRYPGPRAQRGAGARLHAVCAERARRLDRLHRRRPGRHQPRPRTRGRPAHGAARRASPS